MYCLSTFCCVCFKNTKNLQHLQVLDTDGISLLEKIKFCTFENEWNESNAIHICVVCENNLRIAYEFKKKCIETNKLLRGYIFQLQQSPAPKQNPIPAPQERSTDLNESLIEFRASTPIFEFIKHDENQSEYCQSPILDIDKCDELVIKEEPDEMSEVCVDSKEILNLTETIDTSEEFTGFPRQSISNSVTYLSKVVLTLNAEIVRFVKFSEYVRDCRRDVSCPICLKKFSRRNVIYTHMLIHKNKKPFTCTVCAKTFRQKQNMLTHMSIHSGETYYKCAQCDKRFYHYSHMTAHMPSHTGEKPYECTECKRRFGTKSHLTAHMTTHNKHMFRCTLCKKKFKHKYSLTLHKRLHTGEKPYKCSDCGKRFGRRQCMLTHRLIHSDVKPYACAVCPKKYAQKSYLKTHELSHSDERTFSCKHCSKLYKHRGNLFKHVQKYHSKIQHN